jgi:hypothetical protein
LKIQLCCIEIEDNERNRRQKEEDRHSLVAAAGNCDTMLPGPPIETSNAHPAESFQQLIDKTDS